MASRGHVSRFSVIVIMISAMFIFRINIVTMTKADFLQEGILFGTQFPSLGIFINNKVGF